jgi:hypothetical protein
MIEFQLFKRTFAMIAAISSMAACAVGAKAELVQISSRPPGGETGKTPCPTYCEGTGNWADSTLKSAAPGLPSARLGSRFCTTPAGANFSVTPALLTTNGSYFVEVTHGSATSISADIIVAVTMSGATGLPATSDGFQQTKGVGAWYRIGTMTLDGSTNAPTITFTHASGAVSRFYMDGIRFINVNDICLTGLPQLTTVNGPLAAGQTFVNVPAVDATATNVTVYAYDDVSGHYTKLGALTNGITNGVNRVTTTALQKNQVIVASQWKAGVESCLATSGPEVGEQNPMVRVSLGVRDVAGLTNVIGANGGTAGTHLVLMKATGTLNGGFGVAPTGGEVLMPSGCWQTMSFTRGVDPLFGWSGAYGDSFLNNDFVILDAIAFAIEDLNSSGPYVVYLDNFINGTTLIQDFESATNGQNAVTINLPNFSTTTTPYLLSPTPGAISPNISVVTNLNASGGDKSLLLSWQFKDTSAQDWFRATFQGSGTPNPIVDLRQPIYFDILMLPAGQTLAKTKVGLLTNRAVFPGDNATFAVSATGTNAFTYSWTFNDVPMNNATGNSVTFTNLQTTQGGIVAVTVTDGECTITRRASLRVSERVMMTIERHLGGLMVQWDAVAGDTAQLQKTTSLTPPIQWAPVPGTPILSGNMYMLHIETPPATPEFYRIMMP